VPVDHEHVAGARVVERTVDREVVPRPDVDGEGVPEERGALGDQVDAPVEHGHARQCVADGGGGHLAEAPDGIRRRAVPALGDGQGVRGCGDEHDERPHS
jgi:hypothetical protein